MNTFLLWIHPVIQVVAAVIGLWAMWQGIIRLQMTLFKKKLLFPWKNHVKLGKWSLWLWTLGALAFYTTHAVFGYTHITGLHAQLAWPIIALSLFGLVSGHIMDKHKKKRIWLPLAHGVSNILLLVLVLLECWTGIELCFHFL